MYRVGFSAVEEEPQTSYTVSEYFPTREEAERWVADFRKVLAAKGWSIPLYTIRPTVDEMGASVFGIEVLVQSPVSLQPVAAPEEVVPGEAAPTEIVAAPRIVLTRKQKLALGIGFAAVAAVLGTLGVTLIVVGVTGYSRGT